MIIVAGPIHVDPDQRDEYLAGCRSVIEQARQAPGCLDFHLSPTRSTPGASTCSSSGSPCDAVEAFRGSGPSDEQGVAIQSAAVVQHEIASSQAL